MKFDWFVPTYGTAVLKATVNEGERNVDGYVIAVGNEYGNGWALDYPELQHAIYYIPGMPV